MASELEAALCEAQQFAQKRGVTCGSYRLVPSFHSQLHPSATLFNFGFPDAWVALYDHHPEFRRGDPIADFVIRAGKSMTWREAIAAQKLNPVQTAFTKAMAEHGLVDGIATPVFGPHGREAYVTFSWGRLLEEADEDAIEELNAYARKLHRRIVQMTDPDGSDQPAFSRRESEVLVWIARGKSNSDIATILGVSDSTVNTYVKRIFGKMGVNNRMAAALMGLKYGIIRL